MKCWSTFLRIEFGAQSVEVGHVVAQEEVVRAVTPLHVVEMRHAEITVRASQLAACPVKLANVGLCVISK